MRPLALRQARQPRSDRGKARHSVSSTFAYHNRGSSSHQGDDDEDDGASRVSTPSPTTYLNSFGPLDYQPYDIPTSSKQNGDLLIERQTDLLNQTQQMHKELKGGFKSFGKALRGVFSKKKKMLEQILENPKLIQTHSISKPFSSNKFPSNAYHHFTIFFILYQPQWHPLELPFLKLSKDQKINIILPKQSFVDLTQDDIKIPSPKHQISSPSAHNAPSKTPSTKGTSSSSIDYTPKSPTSSTSPPTNGYLNSPTSPPPPPTQENVSMDITLTLSPVTPLDVQFDTPSPSPPIFGHPILWNLLEAREDSCLCCIYNRTLIFGLRDELHCMFTHIEYMLSQPPPPNSPPPPSLSPN
nr:hypothetical protein [Tanacetum cinerariifolium]